MDNNKSYKDELIFGIVEAAAAPMTEAKGYWRESILNILKSKKCLVSNDEEYAILLKSEILYLKKLWVNEMNVIYVWAQRGEMPESDEINEAILKIEKESETEVKDNKIVFKNGKSLDKDDLTFIERYNSINLEDRIKALHEDYIYLRIRDYIILNVYQFLSENKEIAQNIFEISPKEVTQRIADLASNYADICMYPDRDNY